MPARKKFTTIDVEHDGVTVAVPVWVLGKDANHPMRFLAQMDDYNLKVESTDISDLERQVREQVLSRLKLEWERMFLVRTYRDGRLQVSVLRRGKLPDGTELWQGTGLGLSPEWLAREGRSPKEALAEAFRHSFEPTSFSSGDSPKSEPLSDFRYGTHTGDGYKAVLPATEKNMERLLAMGAQLVAVNDRLVQEVEDLAKANEEGTSGS